MNTFHLNNSIESVFIEHNRIIILNFFKDIRRTFKESLEDIQSNVGQLTWEQRGHLSVVQYNITDKYSLKKVLDDLVQEFCSSRREMSGVFIHIDAHGFKLRDAADTPVIKIEGSEEPIYFDDLIPSFSIIFQATCGKMYLSASSCFGISFLRLCAKSIEFGNAPFSYLIGPSVEISDNEAKEFWLSFYTSIYSGTFSQSIFIDSKFHIVSITHLMYQSISSFIENFSFGEFQETVLKQSGILELDTNKVEEERDRIVRKIVREYFCLNSCPQITRRLDLTKIGALTKDSDMILSSLIDTSLDLH